MVFELGVACLGLVDLVVQHPLDSGLRYEHPGQDEEVDEERDEGA